MSAGLDPAMARVASRLAASAQPGPPDETAVDRRRRLTSERTAWLAGPGEPMATIVDLQVPGAAGPLRARHYDATGYPGQPLLLFAHGGGWVTGDIDSHDTLCRAIALRGKCQVLSLDYRLAPEYPLPAAHDDLDATLRWVLAGRHLAGWDGRRVALGGDSAGGHMAAVVAGRHRQDARLRAQLLLYPILDVRTDTPSYRDATRGVTLTADEMCWSWATACPDPAVRQSPELTPLRGADPTGLPPTAIVVAPFDPLAWEARAYVRRLRAADVQVEVISPGGMAHGYLRMTGQIPTAWTVLQRCGRFLQRSFG